MQSRKHSIYETLTNIAIGWGTSFLAWPLFLTPVLHVPMTPGKNVEITVFFTVLSFVRQYLLRRFYNLIGIKR